MSKLPRRLVFAGSPDFAVPALERLAATGHAIAGVLTQPDRPAGRGRQLQASAVKRSAEALGLPVLQPASLRRDPSAVRRVLELRPDLVVVVAYGLMLPRELLLGVPRGCVNLHASLLPRWRGAAPIQAAVLAGDARTGVSLMRLEEGLDTGPVAAMRAVDIGPAETAGELHDRLAILGAGLLAGMLDALLDGSAVFEPQPATGASYAPKLAKADATLDWRESAQKLARRVRAYNPWPVAETLLDGAQLRVWLAHALPAPTAGVPGTILGAGEEGIDVATGEGLLRLTSVQLAGRQRLPAGEFARGRALAGKVLGA